MRPSGRDSRAALTVREKTTPRGSEVLATTENGRGGMPRFTIFSYRPSGALIRARSGRLAADTACTALHVMTTWGRSIIIFILFFSSRKDDACGLDEAVSH